VGQPLSFTVFLSPTNSSGPPLSSFFPFRFLQLSHYSVYTPPSLSNNLFPPQVPPLFQLSRFSLARFFNSGPFFPPIFCINTSFFHSDRLRSFLSSPFPILVVVVSLSILFPHSEVRVFHPKFFYSFPNFSANFFLLHRLFSPPRPRSGFTCFLIILSVSLSFVFSILREYFLPVSARPILQGRPSTFFF